MNRNFTAEPQTRTAQTGGSTMRTTRTPAFRTLDLARPVFLALALALAPVAQAADYYWDPNLTAGAGGGTGTWKTSAPALANWWSGTADVVWPGGANYADFSGAAGTVTLDNGGAALSLPWNLNFNVGGYTLQALGNESLTFGGNAITVGAGVTNDITIDLPVSVGTNARQFANNGTGKLILGNIAGSYGGTYIGVGTIVLRNTNLFGSVGTTNSVILTSGTGSLQLGSDTAFGVGGVQIGSIGSGGMQAIQADRVLANTFVSGGGGLIAGGTQNITITGNYIHDSPSNDRMIVNYISGSGKTLTLTGTLYLQRTGTTRTLSLKGSGNTVVSGIIVDAVDPGKTNMLTVNMANNDCKATLLGTNTYCGGTTITLGTLVAGSTQALGAATGPLSLGGGVLDLAIDTSILAYNTTLSSSSFVLSDRATCGAGITHTLGNRSSVGEEFTAPP